jgi:sRNA-binding regulator protein Hfq
MAFPRHHHFRKNHQDRFGPSHRPQHPQRTTHQPHAPHRQPQQIRQPRQQHQRPEDLVHPEHTGSETAFLKSLVDSHAKVTVVLKNGERLQGHIRYYDQYCFSLGLSAHGPRLFLRKDSVSYIAEE